MVAFGQHHGDLDGYETIVEVIHGGGEILLSVIRPCRMDLTPRKALDMYGSPYLIIPYLLKGEQRDLEDKSRAWIGDTSN